MGRRVSYFGSDRRQDMRLYKHSVKMACFFNCFIIRACLILSGIRIFFKNKKKKQKFCMSISTDIFQHELLDYQQGNLELFERKKPPPRSPVETVGSPK